jgi:D-amino-acid dehydrogenase
VRVVVIGSGLQGVATAWFLAHQGCAVTVLERESAAAQGTSYANAGMLTPSMADPWNAPGIVRHLIGWLGQEDAPFLLRPAMLPSMVGWGLAFLANSRPARYRENMGRNLRLARYSLEVLRELRAELGLHYDERTAGTIKIFRESRAFEAAVRRNAVLAELGLDVRTLTPAEVVRTEPALADVRAELVGGLFCPQDESGDARLFTEALAARAIEASAEFHYGAEVTGFEIGGDRISAVTTSSGRHAAEAFVLATGAWSPQLLAPLGLQLRVRPVKGYSITVPVAGWTAPQMPVIDDALHAAATPLGRRLRVAGTAEIAGYDRALTPSRVDNLFKLLLGLFPSCAPHLDRAAAQPWAGLRPVSADGVPLIGRYRYDNLFLNTGHGHLGWTLACGSARLLTDLMLGRRPEVDARAYAAERRL